MRACGGTSRRQHHQLRTDSRESPTRLTAHHTRTVTNTLGMAATAAQVYTLAVLGAFERKAARARASSGAEGSAAGDARLYFHRVTLLVPPYNPHLIMWPSYVQKLNMPVRTPSALGISLRRPPVCAPGGRERNLCVLSRGPPRLTRSPRCPFPQRFDGSDEEEEEQEEPRRRQVLVQGGMAQLSALASDDEDDHEAVAEELQQHLHALGVVASGEASFSSASEDEEEEQEGGEQAAAAAAAAGRGGREEEGAEEAEARRQEERGEHTGLAVAATLRRLKMFARVDPARGVIALETGSIIQ